MAAHEHLSPYQYKLFMQAKDLMNIDAGDTAGKGSLNNATWVRDRKIEQAKVKYNHENKSLYDNIKKEGVTKPIEVGLKRTGESLEYLSDGHHRVASANDINPEMYIPIKYWDYTV